MLSIYFGFSFVDDMHVYLHTIIARVLVLTSYCSVFVVLSYLRHRPSL